MNVNQIVRWFDPNATAREEAMRGGAKGQAKTGKDGPPPVWLQYLVFTAGVFASPLIRHYRATGSWPGLISSPILGAMLFSLITGFIVFPRAFDTLAKPDASAFARLSTVFTAGVGWEQFSGLPTALATTGQ